MGGASVSDGCAGRDGQGCFAKGRSGNPKGRTPVPPEMRQAAFPHTAEAVAVLVEVLNSPSAAFVMWASDTSMTGTDILHEILFDLWMMNGYPHIRVMFTGKFSMPHAQRSNSSSYSPPAGSTSSLSTADAEVWDLQASIMRRARPGPPFSQISDIPKKTGDGSRLIRGYPADKPFESKRAEVDEEASVGAEEAPRHPSLTADGLASSARESLQLASNERRRRYTEAGIAGTVATTAVSGLAIQASHGVGALFGNPVNYFSAAGAVHAAKITTDRLEPGSRERGALTNAKALFAQSEQLENSEQADVVDKYTLKPEDNIQVRRRKTYESR